MNTSTIDLKNKYSNYNPDNLERDDNGIVRGKIPFLGLKELWFHTGTQCNLACTGCFEESSPSNKRLLFINTDDIQPFVDTADNIGVQSFAFTGGEPFFNPSFISILSYTLKKDKPVTILTNATIPLQRKFSQINNLAQKYPNKLHIRVSLDSYIKQEHNAIRDVLGLKKVSQRTVYDQAIESLQELQKIPVQTYIAGRRLHSQNESDIRNSYRTELNKYNLGHLANTMTIFPEFDSELKEIPTITQNCIDVISNGKWKNYMRTYLRQVAKTAEGMKVYACTVTNDNQNFDYGSDLLASLEKKTHLAHHRCYTMCFSGNSNCSVDNKK